MVCKGCGKILPEGSPYCPSCGTILTPTQPQQQYRAPQQQYGAPQQQYGAPQQQYGAPQQQYGAPQQQYRAPQQQYGAPQQQYGAPQQQYGAPQQQYGAPQQQYSQAQNVSLDPSKANHGKVNFGEAVKLYFKNYINFEGRASKTEYAWILLFNLIVSVGVGFLSGFATGIGAPDMAMVISGLSGLFSLGTLVPGLSLTIRRLHDVGKDWYYIFFAFIPLAGAIILLVMLLKDSEGDNQWGPATPNA